MSNDDGISDDRSRQIDAAIAEYLEALDRGSPLNPDAFLARHESIAGQLREFLGDYSAFRHDSPLGASEAERTTNLSHDSASPPPPPVNGGTIGVLRYFGDYELLQEIARGGMGVVFKARQTSLNRTVAVKMILAGQLASPEEVERFYAEAQAAATLDHPHIVPIFEVGQHDGQHYFSMGYVAGESLANRLSAGPLPPREAASMIHEVALAVQYAHGKGVIHRDLKPANILFDADGRPRVTDFGLAKRQTEASGITATGQLLGTPSFMPPEQISGTSGEVGPAADVYSLGATLYALLTGRPPFQSASAVDTLKQVLEKQPVALREFDANLPRDLETIALKCLEKQPSRRYASAAALADELNRYLSGRPILARPVSRTEHFYRWCRRNPVVAGLIAACGISLIVGAVVATFFAVQSSHRANDNLDLAKQEQAARADAQLQQQRAEQNAQLAKQRQHEAEESAASVRRHLYIANMNLAQTAWEENHMDALHALLERTKPKAGEEDLRGFEWYYWNRLSHLDLMTLRDGANITAIAYSPDGTRLASASWDWMIRIWDLGSGERTMTLKGHTDSVYCVVFSQDGKRLVSAGADKLIKLWDSSTGEELMTLKGHTDSIHGVAFSPDGQRLASASNDGTIKLWDLATGQEALTLKGHDQTVECVAFSPDGKQLASGSGDKTIKLWDVATGEETATLNGHTNYVVSVAFSPDGRRLASGSSDRTIKLWDLTTGQSIATLTGHKGRVMSVAFTKDGKTLASGSDDTTVKVWSAASGKELCTLKGHGNGVACVAFSPDGKRLASAGPEIKIWDAAVTPEINTLFKFDAGVTCVAFSPEGTRIAAADTGATIKVWDTTENRATTLFGGASALAFSPSGRFLAAASSPYISVYDLFKGQDTRSWDVGEQIVTCVAYSPDGSRLASASYDQTIKLWDAVSGKQLLTLSGHTDRVSTVAFSPDGRQLASAATDRTIKVWDAATGRERFSIPELRAPVECVAFSPDGKILAAAGEESYIALWDLATRRETTTFTGHASSIRSIAFSPNGRRLASASIDQTVKLWDVSTGQETLTLRGHDGWVKSVAFSPDGRRLLSGSDDKTVKLWDTLNTTRRDEFEQSLAFCARMVAEHPDDPQYRRTLGNGHTSYGIWLHDELDRATARAQYDLALTIREKLVDDFPDVPSFLIDLGGINCNIGTLVADDDAAGALVWFDRAQQALEHVLTKTPHDVRAIRFLSNTHYARSLALKKSGRAEDAAAEEQASTKLAQELAQLQKPAGDTDSHRNIVDSARKLDQHLAKTTRVLQLTAAVAEYARFVEQYPNNPEYRRTLASKHNALGIQLKNDGDREGARKQYDSALTLLTKLVDDSSEEFPDCVTLLGGVCCNMGLLDIDHDPAEALKWFDRAQEAIERTIAKTPADQTAKTFLRNTHYGRASALEKLGRKDEAAEYRQKAAQINAEIKQAADDAAAKSL